ncbi:hypothetical protein GGI1_07572, partial [Acidithiobacillus sp. GGI-221]
MAGGHLVRFAALDAVVEMNDVQGIEQLPFVFMDASLPAR